MRIGVAYKFSSLSLAVVAVLGCTLSGSVLAGEKLRLPETNSSSTGMLYYNEGIECAFPPHKTLDMVAQNSSTDASLNDFPPPKTLETVVVTAAPISPLTYATDPKLPRQPVPASDGADYLKTIPGFSAIRNGGTNGDPVLRGMMGSRLNLLTNDGSMPGACPSRMDNPMSYVSPETFDELLVIKGPQSVIWGPGASAGTVRFKRNFERFDKAEAIINGSLLGGSFGRNDQLVDATFGAPTGYVRFTANRSDSDDYKDGNGNKVPAAWMKWNTDLAFGWTPDDHTLLEFALGRGDGEARYAGRSMDGAQFERESYSLRFERHDLPGTLKSLESNVFYNDADHVMDNYTLRDPNPASMMPMPMATNVDRRSIGGRVAGTWGWQKWELIAGVDTVDSRHRRRSGMGRNTYRSQAWVRDANLENTGVFAETTFTPVQGQRWIAGGRIDWAKAKDRRETIGSGMMAKANPTFNMQRSETLGSGFIRFEQDLHKLPLTWYAGIGHVERMPDYWELFSPNSGPLNSVNAFSGVKPEKTTQLDVGFQYHTKRWDAWVSGYIGQVDDYILFSYYTTGMMGASSAATNIDARIYGGEAGLDYRFNNQWKAGATVAYAWGKNRDDNTAMPQIPPLESRLSLAYDNQRWSFGALLRIASGQNRVSVGQGNVASQDISKSSGFAIFAINAGYHFNDKLYLTAGIDNVFDRQYSEHLNMAGSADFGFPANPVRIAEPGRLAWVKLNFNY